MKSTVLVLLLSVRPLVMVASVLAAEQSSDERPLLTAQTGAGSITGWKSFHDEPDVSTGAVWKLADGVLVCKGTPRGYLYTAKDYADFVLKLEWRWPPGKTPGKGGLLIRMTGEHKIWPKSLEAQINVGNAGDFWGLAGYELTGPPERFKTLEHAQFGKLTNVKKARSSERPAGQWNKYEIIADGDTVTLKINDEVVNRATGCETTPGKICLTAEGDEIHFRNIRLRPISRDR